MKKALLILALISLASCTDECNIDTAKYNALGVEAEALRLQVNEAETEALKGVLQLQLDQVREEMDAVAQECN